MKRIVKWLAFTLLGATVFATAAGIIIHRYQREIMDAVTQILEESIHGELHIGNYDVTIFHSFPSISISLSNILVYGPSDLPYRDPILQAERISVNVEPLKLLQREIKMKSVDIINGRITIFRTSTGYSNLEVFAGTPSDTLDHRENLLLDMKKIRMINTVASYTDSLRGKYFSVRFIVTENSVTGSDSSIQFRVKGELMTFGLQFDSIQGAFMRDVLARADVSLQLNPKQSLLVINPSTMRSEKSNINFSGRARLGRAGQLELQIQSDPIDFDEGLSILSDTLAKRIKRYKVDKPVYLKAHIRQLSPRTPPEVDVNFSFERGNAKVGQVILEDMSMDGAFTNHIDAALGNDDRNSQIKIVSMHGLLNSLPMKGAATLDNLMDPTLKLQATFDFDLQKLSDRLETAGIGFEGGHFKSTFSYTGKLDEYLDETSFQYNGTLDGEASIVDGAITYKASKLKLDHINAAFAFTEKKFEIQSLAVQQGKNKININGSISDFIPFFTTLETTGKVNLTITSPRLDPSGFINRRKVKQTTLAKTKSKQKISDVLEVLNKKVQFDIDFHVDEFVNGRLKASKLQGQLTLINNSLILKRARMRFAGGTVELNMNLVRLQSSVSPFRLGAKLRRVEIKQFFYAFRDFNQTVIRDSNIEGTLNLDIKLNADIDDNLDVLTPHLLGNANFTIQNGKLKDFEPMQRLSNFLFKGRDLSNVQFGEITGQIGMKRTNIDINRMEIQSTALTMFVEGQYALGGSSDLSIQIPLSNLKKRDQDIAPENIGTDARVGPSVFLRVRPDKSGKTTLSYDPFKKFRKKK